jgi:hypothetical protein
MQPESGLGDVATGEAGGRSARRGRGADVAQVIVISWRDIPAQVNAQRGREREQVILSAKFQRAIDRAKRKANIYTAHDDIAQWRRVSRPCGDDLLAAASAEAEKLEASYSKEHLGRLGFLGGFEPTNHPDGAVDVGAIDAQISASHEDPEDDPESVSEGESSDWGTWSTQAVDAANGAVVSESNPSAPAGTPEGTTP